MLRSSFASHLRRRSFYHVIRPTAATLYQQERLLGNSADNDATKEKIRKFVRGRDQSTKDQTKPRIEFGASNSSNQLRRPNASTENQNSDPRKEKFNEIMSNFFSQRPTVSKVGGSASGEMTQRQDRTRPWDTSNLGGRKNQNPLSHSRKGGGPSKLSQTIRPAGNLDSKNRTGDTNVMQQEDPIDDLRRRFTPNDHNHNRGNKFRNIGKRRPTDNRAGSNIARKSQSGSQNGPTASSSGAHDSSNNEIVSPLSEFIRAAQRKYAESVAKQKKEQEENEKNSGSDFNLTGSVGQHTPLPKWRITALSHPQHQTSSSASSTNLREMRRKDYQQHGGNRNGTDSPQTTKWLKEQLRKDGKIKNASSREQSLLIPTYDISLPEASLLFREKTYVLRKLLETVGIADSSSDDESIMVDPDSMELLAMELDIPFKRSKRRVVLKDEEILMQRRAMASEESIQGADADASEVMNRYESFPPRPPVVCIMGHVDHGKTTLMDSLRKRAAAQASVGDGKRKGNKKKGKKGKGGKDGDFVSAVAGTEAGGITQVISAFQVALEEKASPNERVTFLDTPGHAAFKTMRQSGSDAADVIVLVVAADDGVSEQTIEILDFYKSIVKESNGSISLVVAMNKIDKPGINVEESERRIENQLMEHGIFTENMASSVGADSEYGPPVQLIPVSGLTGEGLDDLIEGLLLQSEVMDLRADDKTRAEGLIMDARVDKGLGIVADCVIRWGSIQKGDVVLSGTTTGKVRILQDFQNNQIKRGLPSQPVRIIGFNNVPTAGDPIIVVESEQRAEEIVTRRKTAQKVLEQHSAADSQSQMADAELQSSGKHMLNQDWKNALEKKHDIDTEDDVGPIRIPVFIKADADGTLAAIRDSLIQVGKDSSHDIQIDPIKTGVGPVLATEVQTAKECGAAIICFNVKNETAIANLADEEGVSLIGSDVIYRLLDAAKEEFANYLPVQPVEVIHGKGKVQAIYEIGGANGGIVAGLQVIEGSLIKLATKSKSGQKLETRFRIIRGGKPLAEDAALEASSLKHFKDDVDEVSKGKECGLSLFGHEDYEEGDVIECFSIEMRRKFV